jgi:hypothetical protein
LLVRNRPNRKELIVKKIPLPMLVCFAISFLPVFGEDEIIICPIDGTEVVDTATRGSLSGSGRDIRLDTKYITRDYVYPVCPTCGFVFVHGNDWKEMLEQDANSVREIILSDEYKALPKGYPGHYYLAKIEEFKHGQIGLIARYYLEASFEAETVRPDLVDEMLELALVWYQMYLPTMDRQKEGYMMNLFTVGEIRRRLGLFEEAKATFALVSVNRLNRNQIAYELVLIEKKDRDPHLLSEFVNE